MKSIIEEASSIVKAIEKGWIKRRETKRIYHKVFEEPEKNFIGMTTKPAKIGIFFGDKPVAHEKPVFKPRQEIKECREGYRKASSFAKASADTSADRPVAQPQKTQSPRPEPTIRPTAPAKPAQQRATSSSFAKATADKQQTEKTPAATPHVEKSPRIAATWNDTMIAATHNWLKKTLSLMGLSSIDFNSEITGKNLKLTFNTPLVADPMHEKQLFRSFAHLIMSSLRNQYKQEIKDLKVILIRPE